MSDRRSFFKKGAQVLLGSIFSFLAIPRLSQIAGFEALALGEKQQHLLLASKRLMEKAGMLRATSLFHYANDGQIEMDLTVVLPSEDQIGSDVDDLAQRVLALIGQ